MKVVDLGLERTRYAVIDETIESRWRRVTSMQHDAVAVVTPAATGSLSPNSNSRTDALVRELRLRGSHGARPGCGRSRTNGRVGGPPSSPL